MVFRLPVAHLHRLTRLGLVPSMHSAPHIPIKHYPWYPIVMSVPVRDRNAEFDDNLGSTTAGLAALHIPGRQRLCRALLRAPASTTELAQRESKSAPRISHYLRRLREMGLITPRRHDADVRYQLDLNSSPGYRHHQHASILSQQTTERFSPALCSAARRPWRHS